MTDAVFWWPSPDAFNDLTVTDTEDGWQLSAPDDTELAVWIEHWNQDEEHHSIFQETFVRALTEHATLVLGSLEEQHGKTEITDEQQCNSKQTKNVSTGSVA